MPSVPVADALGVAGPPEGADAAGVEPEPEGVAGAPGVDALAAAWKAAKDFSAVGLMAKTIPLVQ